VSERRARSTTRRGSPARGGSRRSAAKISILVVDDHTLVRQGVRTLLEGEQGLVVVGEAADGREAVALAERLRPDVVLMDVAMPGLNGVEATRQILASAPGTCVLMLSAHSDEEYVARAMELGAAGYVLKQSAFADLAETIRRAWAGGTQARPAAAPLPQRVGGGKLPSGSDAAALGRATLTPRQAEVLQLVAEGKGNKEIAVALGIRVKTVEKHRQSLMTKLDIHDVAGLTRYAIEIGCIEGRNRSSIS